MPKPYHTPKGDRVEAARGGELLPTCEICGRESFSLVCGPCKRDEKEEIELEAYLEYRDIECECKECASYEIDRADN